ncbi:MAG: hypothetical protein E6248_14885, partial [Clostridium sp.]|uniref:hypothetical protein n=1 Tax=Clostridium sp. TaxID=1506 RepID=UPI00290C2CC6
IHPYGIKRKNYLIDDVKKLISEDVNIDEFRNKIIVTSTSPKILYNSKNLCEFILIPIEESYEKYINLDSVFIDKYILNKYFCEYNKNINTDTYIKNVKRLFKSDKEYTVYIDLKNKYSSNYIIGIKENIRHVLNLDELKKNLTIEEYKYLNNNESFDFVIYRDDEYGYAKKVVQVCVGKHHNEEEFIKKDRTKKKVCELAGIDFEEVF